MADEKLFCPSPVSVPTAEELKETAERMGFTLTGDDVEVFQAVMKSFARNYAVTDRLVAPPGPGAVTSPRLPGRAPDPAENTYNQWAWRTDIAGADTGLLAGKRVVVKDSILLAGVPMRMGSHVLADGGGYIPDEDATIVARVLQAGGRIVGKTSCEDLCLSGHSCTNVVGGRPVLNPHNPAYSSGGSSCGNGVVLATKEADMALANDLGGSGRIPAAWCGVVGLKPTYGLVPCTGSYSMEGTVDHLVPMAGTVKDVALLLEAIAGRDGHDHRQTDTPLELPKYSQLVTGNVSGMKIGMLKEGFVKCDPTVCDVVKNALDKFNKIGAIVEEVSVPQHFDADAVFHTLLYDGVWNHMIEGEGQGSGFRERFFPSFASHLRTGYKDAAKQLSVTTKAMMLWGDYRKKNYGNRFYYKAVNLIPMFRKAYEDVLDKYPVIAMPTTPTTATRLPADGVTTAELPRTCLGMIVNLAQWNYTGLPSVSIPAGRLNGLPVGLLLVSKMWDEPTLLNAAYALEQALQTAGE